MEDKKLFYAGLFIGSGITITVLILMAVLNSEPCLNCGKNCLDASVYCSNCGQQLRIVKTKEL